MVCQNVTQAEIISKKIHLCQYLAQAADNFAINQISQHYELKNNHRKNQDSLQ